MNNEFKKAADMVWPIERERQEWLVTTSGERFYLSPDGDWLIWEKRSPSPADENHRELLRMMRAEALVPKGAQEHQALELMVKELKWYAGKYGLGPAKLQYALAQGEAALAASTPEAAIRQAIVQEKWSER